MEKKYYKGIDITYLDEEDYRYLYTSTDEEIVKDKEFLEVKNKASSLTKKIQNINCFMEGYFAARDDEDIEEGVEIWQAIFKHEKQKFDYNEAMGYAKMGWEYYFDVRGNSFPSSPKKER